MTAMTPCLDRPGFFPRLSSHHQPRPRLSEPLLASDARVRLMCAPAGSGKTALLTECLLQAPAHCTVSWLPLAGAALSVGDFCERLGQALNIPVRDEASLISALAHWQAPTWLFLDDYCRVPDAALDALLDQLLASSSPALTWWLGTRRRPLCNWPRLLLDDELYECEGATMALTPDEIVPLLHHLPAEQAVSVANRVIQRSGGWCAGVRIALLQKCDWSQKQPQQRVDTLLDYLQHELFSSLSPELAEAWRVLAHLPRFNADLCDHLFGAGDGSNYLRQLQTLGCFIEPWREASEWLQIFAPLAQLMRAEQWPEGRSWYRRACQWFAARQDWKSAFEHALLAEEFEVAVSLLQHFSFEQLFEEQTVVLLLRLHDQHGEELTLASPQLIGLITGALLFAGRFEQAQACIDCLSRFMPQPSADLQRELIARWQAQQGWLLHLQGRMEPARVHFQQALAELGPQAWPTRLMCLSGQTQQALLCGEMEQAHAINREALCLARAQGSLLFEGLLELDHAQWLEQRGAPARAAHLLADMHDLLSQRADRPLPLLGRIALRQGRLALCMGQEDDAARFFHEGLEGCRRSQDKRVLYGYLGLAQLSASQGQYAQAFVHLRDAERLMQQRQIPDTVYRGVLLQVSSEFWLQQGRPELAREALSRVLKHFNGALARQAPPATLQLIPRIEYLLVLAEVKLQCASAPLHRLSILLEQAQANGMHSLEAELFLAMAEAAYETGERALAAQYFAQGEQRSDHCQAVYYLSRLKDRSPHVCRAQAPVNFPEQGRADIGKEHLLSHRERQVLELIAMGDSNKQIAEKMFISLHTVKTHVRRIHGKLGVERRTHAVAKARQLGMTC